MDAVPQWIVMLFKLFVTVLLVIAMGLSTSAVFSYDFEGDYDKENKNRLIIKVYKGAGEDMCGAIFSILTLVLLMLSVIIQIITRNNYTAKCSGRCYDIVVLAFAAISALASGGALVGFSVMKCTISKANEAVRRFEKSPNRNITFAGSGTSLHYHLSRNSTAKLMDRTKVTDAIVNHCKSQLKFGTLISGALKEILCMFLIIGIIAMASFVKDEISSSDVNETVTLEKDESNESSNSSGTTETESEVYNSENRFSEDSYALSDDSAVYITR